ncbi:MAG: MFS transporter, partial [Xanthobacteraceae bacterium]
MVKSSRNARAHSGASLATNEQPSSTSTEQRPGDRALIRRLLLFFALVYVVEGLAQPDGLIAQPLSYYLKTSEGWTAAQITAFTSLLYAAWIIKPLYGLISDFVPLFGYRRKSYPVLANIAAVVGFVWATQLSAPRVLFFALAVTAYAMAISSTLCGAVLVENGQRLRTTSRFVNQQWLWYNIAGMAAAVAGGQLVQHLLPQEALHGAAALVAFTPVIIIAGALFLVPERKVSINIQGMKDSFASLKSSLKRRELWLIAGFLFLYNFSPGLSTPLYFTMTDTLKFSQSYIGILSSISALGWIAGALLYRPFFGDLSLKQLLNVSIGFGVLTTAAFLFLSSEASAAIIYFGAGFGGMLAMVATLTLAADYCPPGAEGFTFAALMSAGNLASTMANNVGALLYTHVFEQNLRPLVVISAAATAVAFLVVPLLRLGDKKQSE